MFFQNARKVVYQTDYPDLSFSWFSENLIASTGVRGDTNKSTGGQELDRLFLTKAEQWKYEAEWRISKKFLHPLITGCRTQSCRRGAEPAHASAPSRVID